MGSVCLWGFVSQWVLRPHSGTLWAHLMCVCVCVCGYVCEACVSHQSSGDPRALMWNPFNPRTHSVVGWCVCIGGGSPTAQLYSPNLKHTYDNNDSWSDWA